MLPSLRTIVASPAVQQGRPEVLAGRDRLDRGVRWVHVVEITDLSGLLTGGELILSTGLPLSGDGAAAFVDGLVRADAAGLVVELGAGLPAVPEAAVAAARAADLPLIALHSEVRFVDITEEVHRAIVAEQYTFVEFARSTHETFTALSLERADAPRIVTAAADLCGLSVVLEDLSRRVLAHAARGRPAASLLARWEERSRRAPSLPDTGVSGPEGWLTAPVGGQSGTWARLVVPHPGAEPDLLTMVLERAAQALELGRMAERDRAGLVTSAHGGLLTELSFGRIAAETEAATRAAALGLPEATGYLPLVVHRVGAPTEDPVARHDRTRRVVEQVVDAAARAHCPALVGSLRLDQVGVLAAVGRGDPEQLLDRLTAPLSDDLVVGVGDLAAGVLTAGASLALAGHVAEVAAALRRTGGRRWFRNTDVRLHGLVALLHDDPRVQAFTEAELGPLLAHDGARGTDLVGLLRQYIAAGGNKTRLADSAHRSRPAVYKQLARIEEVLGIDLTSPDSFLALGVALMAYDRGR